MSLSVLLWVGSIELTLYPSRAKSLFKTEASADP
jgi:hypothetical protein